MAFLEVEDIHTYYGNIEALKGVTLTVEEGECVTLIGSNGAGKSTTLRSISGLTPAREGSVAFEGRDITRTAPQDIVRLGISQSRERQRAGTMSGGEQQMLAIGRALMARPRLLLLDEPSMGISPILTERIYDTIAEINRQGTTILLVEQNANFALGVSQRGYVLETGKVVLSNQSAALKEDPEVQKAYLGG